MSQAHNEKPDMALFWGCFIALITTSFAISIILFNLIIDKVGYRAAMLFSFVCYALYAVLALRAHGILHQSGRRHAFQARQNQVAQHPARRLAR